MNVVKYTRESTIYQDGTTQHREVDAFISAQDMTVVGTYTDMGVSGARTKRPGLDQLLKDAWKGKFQAVIVWELSRLARNTLHALELLREFEQMKIRLIAVKQTFDTDTYLGKAFFTLAAMFAEMERSMIIERVKAGMARAKAEGKRVGRPIRSFDLCEAQRLRAQGQSIRQIAHTLGVPRSTVAKRLHPGAPCELREMPLC